MCLSCVKSNEPVPFYALIISLLAQCALPSSLHRKLSLSRKNCQRTSSASIWIGKSAVKKRQIRRSFVHEENWRSGVKRFCICRPQETVKLWFFSPVSPLKTKPFLLQAAQNGSFLVLCPSPGKRHGVAMTLCPLRSAELNSISACVI